MIDDEWRVPSTMVANIMIDIRVITPSVSFSPESGGRVKPSTAIDTIRIQGTMRLNE